MRTTLGSSFATRAPVQPMDGKARIIGRNTFRYRTTTGLEVTRLHVTDIVQRHPDNRVTLDSGGWRTMTTKARMNDSLSGTGFKLGSERGIWTVYRGSESVPFYDGMLLPDAFKKRGEADRKAKRAARLKERIKHFVCSEIQPGKVPVPNLGDCLICRFESSPVQRNGSGHMERQPERHDSEHLLSHVQERYMHGSLIVNACRWNGWTDTAIQWFAFSDRPDIARVRKTVRRFLQHRLGLPY